VGVGQSTPIAENEPGRAGIPIVEEPARWRRRYDGTLRRAAGDGRSLAN
jgi:hypothetical protein